MNVIKHKLCFFFRCFSGNVRLLRSYKDEGAVCARKYLPAQYGGRHMVTLIPGDGIGPELLQHMMVVFKLCHAPIDFEIVDIRTVDDIEDAITSIKRNGVAIKGTVREFHFGSSATIPDLTIRKSLDLYSYVMWCKGVPHLRCKQPKTDIVIIRQNTEGEYSMLEHESVPGVVESLKIITKYNTERLARWACRYALKYKRKKITVVHKANIMKLSDGLFRKTAKEVILQHPDLQYDEMIVDAFTTNIVSDSSRFDICLLPNLYGTIAGNVLSGILGGPGLFAGINHGDHYAVFELGTRNLGSNIAGKDIANPVSMLDAGVELLFHLGHVHHAKLIRQAILDTIKDSKYHTRDLGGTANASDMITKIMLNMEESMQKQGSSTFTN